MHEAQTLLDANGFTVVPATPGGRILSPILAPRLVLALKNDASGYLKHSALALAQGVAGLEAGYSTWASVQLYYSVFCTARAMLCLQQVCIFYVTHTPFSIEAIPGGVAKKLKGTTHQATLLEFEKFNPLLSFVTQQIELLSPTRWMQIRREQANYKLASPIEPLLSEHVSQIIRLGVRRALNAYLADAVGLYAFDNDHAILAYPLKFVEHVLGQAKALGILPLEDEFSSYLRTLLSDRTGLLTPLYNLLSDRA